MSEELTQALYSKMPGAPKPVTTGMGEPYWPGVMGNEHWQFCAAIVAIMDGGNHSAVQTAVSG